jgi:hypothetical protein
MRADWFMSTLLLYILQVDQWLDTASQLVSGLGFEVLCGRLNDYLSMRSFFVGFTTTAADFAIWGQLHGEQQHTVSLGSCSVDCITGSRGVWVVIAA